jgi:hypothetical protein
METGEAMNAKRPKVNNRLVGKTWHEVLDTYHNWTHTGAVHTRGFSPQLPKKNSRSTRWRRTGMGGLLRENITKIDIQMHRAFFTY